MLPRSVNCQDCGQIAAVRGYGRVEYDWPETTTPGSETTTPTINYVRLTIDCPCCGVKPQDFYPNGAAPVAQPSAAAAIICDAPGRQRAVGFRTFRPANERRFGRRNPK